MPSIVTETVFSEPSGRPQTLIGFAGALVFLGLYVYFGVLEGSQSSGWLLYFVVANALSGTAEALPKTRRRAAGVLRLTALLVMVGFLVLLTVAPALVTG